MTKIYIGPDDLPKNAGIEQSRRPRGQPLNEHQHFQMIFPVLAKRFREDANGVASVDEIAQAVPEWAMLDAKPKLEAVSAAIGKICKDLKVPRNAIPSRRTKGYRLSSVYFALDLTVSPALVGGTPGNATVHDHPHGRLVKRVIDTQGRSGVNLVGPPGSEFESVAKDIVDKLGRNRIVLDLRPHMTVSDLERRLATELQRVSPSIPARVTLRDYSSTPLVCEIRGLDLLLAGRRRTETVGDDQFARVARFEFLDAICSCLNEAFENKHFLILPTVIPYRHLAEQISQQPFPSGSSMLLMHLNGELFADWDGWTQREAERHGLLDCLDTARAAARGSARLYRMALLHARGEQPLHEIIDQSAIELADEIWQRLPSCCQRACAAVAAGETLINEGCRDALEEGRLIERHAGRSIPVMPVWRDVWARQVT